MFSSHYEVEMILDYEVGRFILRKTERKPCLYKYALASRKEVKLSREKEAELSIGIDLCVIVRL